MNAHPSQRISTIFHSHRGGESPSPHAGASVAWTTSSNRNMSATWGRGGRRACSLPDTPATTAPLSICPLRILPPATDTRVSLVAFLRRTGWSSRCSGKLVESRLNTSIVPFSHTRPTTNRSIPAIGKWRCHRCYIPEAGWTTVLGSRTVDQHEGGRLQGLPGLSPCSLFLPKTIRKRPGHYTKMTKSPTSV